MRLPALAVATLVALLAFASPAFASSVTNLAVDNATPSAATGALTVYRVSFRTSTPNPALSGSDVVHVALPPGTGTSGWQSGTIRDVTRSVDVGSCGIPNAQLVSTCGLFSSAFINAGDQVVVTLRGLTNGSTGAKTVQVDTTRDADAATSPAFQVVNGGGVSQPTVTIADPSAAAGARTRYVIGFTASATGGMSGEAGSEMTLTLPPGTTAPEWQSGTIRDVTRGVDVGTCTNPASGLVSTCGFFSSGFVNPGDQLQITLRGLTNGAAGAGKTVQVSTTSDLPTIASNGFTIVAGNSVSQPTVTIADPSAAAGARTRYVIGFTASITGGLSGEAGSQITLTLPAGTTAPEWQSGTIRDVTRGVDVGTCTNPASGLVSTCGFFSSGFVNPGDQLQITLRGLTNGAAGAGKTVQVSTTSDLPTIASSGFTIVAGNSVSQPTVTIADPSAAAGARTRYVIGFTASITGGLSGEAGSQITLTLPAGTTAPEWQSGTIRDVTRGVDVGTCTNPASGLVSTCGFFSSGFVNPGDQLQITLRGLTNGAAGAGKTVQVSTTSDLPTIASSGFTIVAGNSVSQPTVTIADPSAAAGARTRYVIGFTASATGGLSGEAGSEITLSLPSGTTAAGWQSGTIRSHNVDVGTCTNPGSTLVSTCGFFSNGFVNPGDQVQITLRGLTNSGTGTGKAVQVTTTSDVPTVPSSAFQVVAGNALTGVGVTVGSTAPLTTTQYVVALTTSATGGLSAEAGSEIVLTLPEGTSFSGFQSGSLQDVTRGVTVGSCGSRTGLVIRCGFFSNGFVTPGDALRISFSAITNPPTAGPYSLTVSTTSDTPAVGSGSYVQNDTFAPETTIDSGPGSGTPTFTFSANEAGSRFECRIDGGAFAGCTSPFTVPALGAGEHVFAVRAIDPAGNPDPTPAIRGFVIGEPTPTPTPTPAETASPQPTTSPTPAPTATPTPEPTPQFNQTVVVESVGGTVQVCPKGGKCFTLGPGQAIPMGSTVDTKKGVVELTSLPSAGAPGQTARFSEGIFRIAQRGGVTELTLTEPLAPCSKKARSAAKKPKSRRLWGDGRGNFRTTGKYAAATVRGTRWLVQDTCSGTLVRVTEGAVSVRDKVKNKNVIVRAGKRYTAKPRR